MGQELPSIGEMTFFVDRGKLFFKPNPDAQPWEIRIGHRAVYHFSSQSWKQNQ